MHVRTRPDRRGILRATGDSRKVSGEVLTLVWYLEGWKKKKLDAKKREHHEKTHRDEK